MNFLLINSAAFPIKSLDLFLSLRYKSNYGYYESKKSFPYLPDGNIVHGLAVCICPDTIGYGVTPDGEDGDVIVKNGYKLIIKNGSGGVTLDYGFECEKGAVLEIK